ncbi:MAG TPA: hypothetical protein VM073_11720 [Usitatibacter sp.]|nr:hypothetical protein [Usitatibacter sp.]
MRRLRAWVVAAALAIPTAAAQEPAMRLEALSERIAKLQAQLGQGVLADRSKRAMPEAVRDFEAALKAATTRASTPEARENYLLLKLLWHDYRAWALKPPTRDNAKRLADRAEEVGWIASKGARMLHEGGRRGTGRLALDASHAGTLAQRVARLHLLRRWGLRDDALGNALAVASADLRATLEKLRQAPHNTPEIDTELQVAEGQMGFLLQAARELEGGRGSLRQMEFIAKAGDHILESMERAVRLYEGLSP